MPLDSLQLGPPGRFIRQKQVLSTRITCPRGLGCRISLRSGSPRQYSSRQTRGQGLVPPLVTTRLGQISGKESPVGIFEEKGANNFF